MTDRVDSEDDEELKLAIALSLQTASSPVRGSASTSNPSVAKDTPNSGMNNVVGNTSTSMTSRIHPIFDGSRSELNHSTITSQTSTTASATSSLPSSLSNGFSGVDRKKMEGERLARLAERKKRVAEDSAGGQLRVDEPAGKRQKVETSFRTAKSTVTARISPPPSNRTSKLGIRKFEVRTSNGTAEIGGNGPTGHPTIQYPHGTVKKTWSRAHTRENDIKIEEVLLRDHLRLAVLSSFQWDNEWLSSKLSFGETKMVFCVQAKTAEDRERMRQEAVENGKDKNGKDTIIMCFPPMDGEVNCMHSKLMLLSYKESLRIAVPSANLMPHDWGETGTMENSVFLIDLPRLDADKSQQKSDLTPFGKELLYFLEKSEMPDLVLEGILKFDFSATEKFAFVHSVGVPCFGRDLHRTGFNGLSRAVRQLGLETNKEQLDIDYTISSMGAVNMELLQLLYQAARGLPTDAQTRTKNKSIDPKIKDHFRVYFPTEETVLNSLAGYAGTICFQEDWYDRPTFPKSVFRDYVSTRNGILSHNKIMLAYTPTKAWAYVGSANLSESAWGKIVRDPKRKENKLVCRNWECGVLVPAVGSAKADADRGASTASLGSELAGQEDKPLKERFRGCLDVPFEIPAPRYDGRDPWFFMKGQPQRRF